MLHVEFKCEVHGVHHMHLSGDFVYDLVGISAYTSIRLVYQCSSGLWGRRCQPGMLFNEVIRVMMHSESKTEHSLAEETQHVSSIPDPSPEL